jgi:hypothetical protein
VQHPHHRHYDLERDAQSVAGFVSTLRREVVNLRRELDQGLRDLRDAQERIRALEGRQPDHADPEADGMEADLARSRATLAGSDPSIANEAKWRDIDEGREAHEPRLRRIRRIPADEPFSDFEREEP